MPINRAPFNALVDDDGSGTTGTVWNKNQIKTVLLDPIDALVPSGIWTPTLTTSGGGTPAYAIQSGTYGRSDKIVTVTFRLGLSSKGSLAAGGALIVGGLPFPSAAQNGQSHGGLVFPSFAGLATAVAALGSILGANGTTITLVYLPAAGAVAMGFLLTENVGNSLDLYGMGSYVCQ